MGHAETIPKDTAKNINIGKKVKFDTDVKTTVGIDDKNTLLLQFPENIVNVDIIDTQNYKLEVLNHSDSYASYKVTGKDGLELSIVTSGKVATIKHKGTKYHAVLTWFITTDNSKLVEIHDNAGVDYRVTFQP